MMRIPVIAWMLLAPRLMALSMSPEIPGAAYAQSATFTLIVESSHQLWNTLYLYSTYGRVALRMDSASLVNGSYVFEQNNIATGFYMIGPADNNQVPVILNTDEKEVRMRIKGARMDGGCQAVSSTENQAWFEYQPRESELTRQIREARTNARKGDPSGEFDKRATALDRELTELQNAMMVKYPNTFFATILSWKQEPMKNDRDRYWDNIDFTDERMIRTPIPGERIQNYMRSFSRGENSEFIRCIEAIVDRAKVNDVVLEFMLIQMVTGFYESGMEQLSSYIIEQYIHGDACGNVDFSDLVKSTAESIEQLGIGRTPPPLKGVGVNGDEVDLMKTTAANRYTLLLFWSSWCEHCKAEAPEVNACYRDWKIKGFEIIGYSVDQQEGSWKKAIAERSFDFPNICGYKLWDSSGAKAYRITRTPAYYLLDQSGIIVLKPKNIREVKQFLSTNLR